MAATTNGTQLGIFERMTALFDDLLDKYDDIISDLMCWIIVVCLGSSYYFIAHLNDEERTYKQSSLSGSTSS